MINTNDIEAGDKVHLRDGSVIVARWCSGSGGRMLCNDVLSNWNRDGNWISASKEHPLDIIRIEKAPMPVVRHFWLRFDNDDPQQDEPDFRNWDNVYKITVSDDGETIERVK